ncbi:hypothetical protein JW796_00940 [Candidatus Dojkabacteria bacterium]|nr:hypothetical protein [Candidatus Dojkabacteria bacterium]
MRKLFWKRKKAFSLAEVIISLGVASTTMVVAISMTSQSLRLAKENEIENTANEILVQTLELVKSPVPLNIIPSIGGNAAVSGLVGSYKINKTLPSGQEEGVGVASLESVSPFVDEISAGECTQGSEAYRLYKVDVPEINVVMCNQIIFKQLLDEDGTYSVVSVVVYEIGGEKVVEKVQAFRKGNFNIMSR